MNTNSEYILALDIGTQSVRAALSDPEGKILAIEQISHTMDCPYPGWAQQSPDKWWGDICTAIRQMLARTYTDPARIAAIACCGQMHGSVGIDANGNTTTPLVQLWCDKRCQCLCQSIAKDNQHIQLSDLSANPINPSWSGFKVAWYKNNQPDSYKNAKWFLVPKDFINFKLTGVAATDPSEASGSFILDCNTEQYSEILANVIGVELDKFAQIYRSNEIIGTITESAAQSTGLRAGTPVVAGGGDFPVALLGFGVVGYGIASDMTGTSTLFATHSRKPLINPAIQNLRHVVDGWIPFTILDTGGVSMQWCRSFIASARGGDISYEELIAMAEDISPGSENLIFHPYLLGERRLENTNARGSLINLTMNHNAKHFIRSVMEGVAYALGRDVELFSGLGLEIHKILCAGGGTKNHLWNQIKANVLQKQLIISSQPEAGLRGAALLGASGVGLIDDIETIAVNAKYNENIIEPEYELSRLYKNAIRESKKVYDHLLGFWQ